MFLREWSCFYGTFCLAPTSTYPLSSVMLFGHRRWHFPTAKRALTSTHLLVGCAPRYSTLRPPDVWPCFGIHFTLLSVTFLAHRRYHFLASHLALVFIYVPSSSYFSVIDASPSGCLALRPHPHTPLIGHGSWSKTLPLPEIWFRSKVHLPISPVKLFAHNYCNFWTFCFAPAVIHPHFVIIFLGHICSLFPRNHFAVASIYLFLWSCYSLIRFATSRPLALLRCRTANSNSTYWWSALELTYRAR